MVFYLVRHGQTDWNKEGKIQGQTDIPMNGEGVRQMNELADRIVREGITFDKLIASPMDRARKSAEIIAEKTGFSGNVVFDADFIERNCGLLEGEIWHPGLNMDDPKYKRETLQEICERAETALNKYAFPDDAKIMIVSHGAMLAAVRTVLSDYKMDYKDNTVPVIQGNVLCCVKNGGEEASFFNLF